MTNAEIVAALCIVDLYEAWRTDGKVWFRSWSDDMHLVRIPVALISAELNERGVSLAEAKAEWQDWRNDR